MGYTFHENHQPDNMAGSQPGLVIPERFRPVDSSGQLVEPALLERRHNDDWRFMVCLVSDPCEYCGDYPTHVNSIVIAIDGACRGNGTDEARSSIGVVVGHSSKYNLSEVLLQGPHTNQRAELYAAKYALEQALAIYASETFGIGEDDQVPLSQVCIKSDSEYVVKGMTEWIQKWEVNGYRTTKNQPVTNADLFKSLIAQVQLLSSRGVHVSFWLVPRSFNDEADDLANRAFDTSGLYLC